ncbi:MAG: hypothetical protein IJT82_03860 [Schwartzia sp.]|nr:hypothetical protein [Schwartzia sp. (in: firmicutes)]
MIYNYIKENYGKGDPIFFNDLPCTSKGYLRHEIKKLVDEGKIKRVYNGVYYLPYTTILGTEGGMSILKYVDKKYKKSKGIIFGYTTGLQLVNRAGFTSQNSAFIEVCSNKATSRQRINVVDGIRIIIYKPKTEITNDNVSTLQFLDLLSLLDKFCEIEGIELKERIKRFILLNNVNLSLLKNYLSLFPEKIYKYLYLGDVKFDGVA